MLSEQFLVVMMFNGSWFTVGVHVPSCNHIVLLAQYNNLIALKTILVALYTEGFIYIYCLLEIPTTGS